LSGHATTSFDAVEFRKALGSFATGVTIITTRAPDGTPVGLTANSFNSVSLQPPLVLWSLANTSMSLATFRAAQHWAVHVLATDQEELSARFAKRGESKFAGLDVEEGVGGVPMLQGCSARFQCKTAFQYEGGDHVIFLGEVLAFDRNEMAPLVFHGGRYAHATRRDPLGARPRSAYLEGSFGDDFLGYLLGRSHFRMFAQIRQQLEQAHLSDQEFYVLSALTLKPSLTIRDLDAGMAGVLDQNSHRAIESLVQHGLARETMPEDGAEGPAYELTTAGRECALGVITAAKAVEAQVLDRLGAGEAPVLKSLLNRLLAVIDPESAALWQPPASKGPTP
jgi:3-hydroxy-9,10-secoandrosta-1,3,5(10)-triene-9,17-dione monooxygenase reductase component